MRSLPTTPVFTRAEARDLGWSDSAISRALRAGRLVAMRRGQLIVPAPVAAGRLEAQPLDRRASAARIAAIAAARDIAGSVVSHRSALLMHGLPVVGGPPPEPEITVAPDGRGTAFAAHLHRATIWPDELRVVNGVAVLSEARSVIDVGRHFPVSTAVAAIDAALNRGLVSINDLEHVTLRCWNWPGIRRAPRAMRLSDGRAESPLESVSRLIIGWLRLPPPDLQPLVLDQVGRPVARLDFYWDEFGVAGEADGRSKYDERTVLTAEKERQEIAEDLGICFVRWGWREAIYRPRQLQARLEAAFERGRRRDRSGFPREWSIERSKPVTNKENVIHRRV